ncbi:MAG: DEAD/DEAH box helicase [Planctomycetaceae bacterium]
MSRFGFHPIIERWFAKKFAGPTEPQERGWPEIAAGRHTLIAAPTGSGKTLTAFMAVIDRLVREGLEGRLAPEMRVVYISPLRALSNDMQKNLRGPLEEIAAEAAEAGFELPEIRVGLRTGDTSQHERMKLVKNPPHILVTTPESLFLMLTAERGRAALSTVDTVIVDEIHALARDKRGSHLSLSLERLESLVRERSGEGECEPRRHGGTEGGEAVSGQPSAVSGDVGASISLSPAAGLAVGEEAIAGERAGVRGRGQSKVPLLTLTLSPDLESTQNPVIEPGEREPAERLEQSASPGEPGSAGTSSSRSSSPHLPLAPSPSPPSVPPCLRGSSPPLPHRRLQRIGLSATQKPIDRMARFLVGAGDAELPIPEEPPPRETPPECDGPGCHEEVDRAGQILSREQPPPIEVDCSIIDVGHQRLLDLAIETPQSELGAVCSHELWAEVNARLVELINSHRSTLIFVNTRRMAERVTFQLTELLGEEAVSSHHGSLSAPIRLKTEQRLKSGDLKAVVATASLELGIDVGYIDLVIQLGSPRSIATFLQRIGRSGHALGLVPKGRIFALTRDELLESMGLIRAIRSGRLDVTPIPNAPLDILAQQIVAEVATGERNTDDLYDMFRRAEPYRMLRRSHFDQIVKFVSEGVTDTGGRVHALLHHDHVQKRLRPRPSARLTTINNGGAIPETDVLRVVVEPERTVVGSVDEEFGIESQRGDIFLLGNTSWRIEMLQGNDLVVSDAHGAPPTIPFWRGEGPGRTIELSEEVSQLRREIEDRVKFMASGGAVGAAWGECEPQWHGGTEGGETVSGQPSAVSGDVGASSSLSPAADVAGGEEVIAGERAGVRGRGKPKVPPLTLTLSPDLEPTQTPVIEPGEREPAGRLEQSASPSEPGSAGASPSRSSSPPPPNAPSPPSVPPCLRGSSPTNTAPLATYEAIAEWLVTTTSCTLSAAQQMVTYVAAQQAAVGLVPTQDRVIFERFFDETGGMQLVVHAPFGARINRAWGLAMRKRFCRSFDFELQATADDDGFILSLGPQHSFPIESLFPMLRADNAQNLLEQAILAVPMFQLRWRWNATRALLVARQKNGKKVPPALQRFRSDDLLTAVFPRLTGCQENIVGDHVLPDHPLVEQTMYDCLNEALDIDGLLELLSRVERGEIQFIARDTREPSPFSYELLNSNPYAFLDGGEVQERRARAVQTRRTLTVSELSDLGRLNPEAIEQVVNESRPVVRNADELHDVLLSRIVLPVTSAEGWRDLFEELRSSGRAASITLPNGTEAWVCAERWLAAKQVYKQAVCDPPLTIPSTVRQNWEEIEALVTLVRGAVEFCGPTTAEELAAEMSLGVSQVFSSLEALEGEGTVLRGRFRPERAVSRQQSAVSNSASGTSSSLSPALESTQNPGIDPGEREPAGQLEKSASPGETGSAGVSPSRPADSSSPPLPIAPSPPPPIEWCHRRLLARIHRLTVAGLRREIEPVDIPTFVRFLTRHQMVWPESRRTGSNAVYDVITQLQGIDIAAIAWEADILPLRVTDYRREWLDELSLTGEVTWGRLYPPARDPDKTKPNASLTRVAPVSICLREDMPWLLATAAETLFESLGSQAQEVVQILSQNGAMFATDVLQQCRMLPSQLDDVLGELVTRGWVTADGFSGLRSLIREADGPGERYSSGRGPKVVRHRRNATVGRWTLWRGGTVSSQPSAVSKEWTARSPLSPAVDVGRGEEVTAGERAGVRGQSQSKVPPLPLSPSPTPARGSTGGLTPPRSPGDTSDRIPVDVVEQWAWQLLRRWGVVFRDLLNREPGAPRWWELLQVYRKLEARGEIRGGRFITGVAGEQFALGDTIRELRKLKESPTAGELVVLSACDPLNLVGILGNDARFPSQPSNRIALFNGIPVGVYQTDVQLWPTCPKSLAPFISAQLRTGKTMAVAIPKGSAKSATPEREPASSRPPAAPNVNSQSGGSGEAVVGSVPRQEPLTPVEKLMNKRRPRTPSKGTIPRPRIS